MRRKNEEISPKRKVRRGKAIIFWVIGFSAMRLYTLIGDAGSELRGMELFTLQNHNVFLLSFLFSFCYLFLMQLTDYLFVCVFSGEYGADTNRFYKWLADCHGVSFQKDQLSLKDENRYLCWQIFLCLLGFFLGLQRYILGLLAIGLYAIVYLRLKACYIKSNRM